MESAELLGVEGAYDKSLQVMERLLGLTVAESALESTILEHANGVKPFYHQKAQFPVRDEGPILVAQADGKGVLMVRRETLTRRPAGAKAT